MRPFVADVRLPRSSLPESSGKREQGGICLISREVAREALDRVGVCGERCLRVHADRHPAARADCQRAAFRDDGAAGLVDERRNALRPQVRLHANAGPPVALHTIRWASSQAAAWGEQSK